MFLAKIDPELRSKGEKRRIESKEDIKHILEEILDFVPDEMFYKVFSRKARHGIQHITNMSKEYLAKLEWKEDSGDVSKLEQFEVGILLSLNNYFTHLKVKGNFPSDPRDLRHNNITLDDWEDSISNPISTRIIESTVDITSKPPPGLTGSSGSSLHQLTPFESFK